MAIKKAKMIRRRFTRRKSKKFRNKGKNITSSRTKLLMEDLHNRTRDLFKTSNSCPRM